MNHAEQFYPKLHATDPIYSAGQYHVKSLFSDRVVKDWAAAMGKRRVRIADIGCGKGVFLRDFTFGLKDRWGINDIDVTGVDLVRSSNNLFDQISPNFNFVQQNLDGQALPFKDASFDFLCCNQVLEHIFETEKLVREFRRVLAPDGLCIIGVPNLSAWVNRIFFLFAGQPLGSELGTEKVSYGFWPGWLKPKLEKFHPSGHIRDFTPRGLHDLTTHCGFKTAGWWKPNKGPMARLGKWAGRDIAILLKPN